MGMKICMNTSCGVTTTSHWKKGWELKSGQIADLCFNCGSAYEKLAYCDTFHYEETGWRECSLCNKRLHCGCSASLPFIEIQDFGGVWCINCAYSAGCHPIRRDGMPSEGQTAKTYISGEMQNPQASNKFDAASLDKRSPLSLANMIEGSEARHLSRPQADHTNTSFGKLQLDVKHAMGIVGIGFPNLSHPPIGTPKFSKPSIDKLNIGVKDMHEQQMLPSLNISLGTTDSSSFGLPPPGCAEEGERSRPSLLQPGQKPRHILSEPSKTNLPKGSEANKDLVSQIRIARPPAEGRLRNQLLPRYWPRITDQELQKLSGDLNSTIVPLFEKVLSASDASRIGRLVLPKACAEAYFPPINQSEGLPLKIQDINGNEWIFQFRFWPNNNSRMYVLEGVTPCIQSMQLQAGDTVTFSRIDPGGKLIMGFRKAPNSGEKQDAETSASHNGVVPGDSSCSNVGDNQQSVSVYSGLLHPIGGSKENSLKVPSERSKLENGDTGWSKSDKFKGRLSDDLMQRAAVTSDKKKSRNIGSKNKRLLMHSDDALELRITWDEAQDLLRPPPTIEPNVVIVEEFEFEEYNEPPVFGKRTIFANGLSRGKDQWAQCDRCAKWRKLPLDVLLPSKWFCADNIWDINRSSCSVPEEISSEELDTFSGVGKETKNRKLKVRSELVQECEPSGLDALATAAVLGDPARDLEEPSSVATTRHPRHRPGCTCIVCIQPPSGKGNHKPNCTCNVCLTVKRRFKTLMMRKKRRQCEREAEMSQQQDQNDLKHHHPAEKSELNNQASPPKDNSKSGEGNCDAVEEGECSGKATIDLNCDPTREEDMQAEGPADTGIFSLVQAANINIPTEMHMNQIENQNGTATLMYAKENTSTSPLLQPQTKQQSEPESSHKCGLEAEPEPVHHCLNATEEHGQEMISKHLTGI